eukprot:s40_g29.t1
MEGAHKLQIGLKNTFLDFHEEEEPMVRSQSWSHLLQLPEPEPTPEVCRLASCKPCVYFQSQRGCDLSMCGFCHLPHDFHDKKKRPRKKTRANYKDIVDTTFQVEEPMRRFELQQLASEHNYVRKVIIAKLNAHYYIRNIMMAKLNAMTGGTKKTDGTEDTEGNED